MLVTLVGWTCSRAPILPSGSEPVRVKYSSISASYRAKVNPKDSSASFRRASQTCWTRITEVTAAIAATGSAPQCARHCRPASSIGSKRSGAGI